MGEWCVASPFLPLLCKSCLTMIMLKGLQKWKQYVLLLARIYCKLRVYCKLRYLVILILNLLFCYQVAHTVCAKVVIIYHESCELKPCIEKAHEFVFIGCVRSFVGTDPCVWERVETWQNANQRGNLVCDWNMTREIKNYKKRPTFLINAEKIMLVTSTLG